MIHWLFASYFAGGGIVLRMGLATLLSFIVVMGLGRRFIHWLIAYKIGDIPEFDHADLNELTRHKSTTPTMGGALIVLGIFVSVVLVADLSNFYIRMGLFALIWLGGLGAADDWIKLRYSAGKGSRDGLRSWEKILFQIGGAVILAVFMWRYGQLSEPMHYFYLPIAVAPVAIGLFAHVVVTVATMVGSSNAVNLTDGMDGLATGCVMLVTGVLWLFSWIVGVEAWANLFRLPPVPGAAEMTILCAAILGACAGFFWFNAHPAQVFMGDTGSLPLGGVLGYIAVVTRQELVLLIAGGVFAMEAVSVILQVSYYKMTKRRGGLAGKRIFRCAPLHHHFHLGGWPETKVVARFWVMGLVFAALALLTLKLR